MDGSFSEQADAGRAHVATHTHVDGDGVSCGELLRRARERRGLTLPDIAHATKIPLRHLDALERDEFAALPGGLYRRAEVRAYADVVGLDRTVALARLHDTLDEIQPPPPASGQPAQPPSSLARLRARLSAMAGVAMMTGAIALAVWASRPATPELSAVQPANALPDAPDLPAVQPASALSIRAIEPSLDPKPQPPIEHPAPAAAPLLESHLTVVTEPTGARVTVNGVGWGVTPVTVRHLTPGPKTVRVTLAGYVTEERLLRLEAGAGVTTVRIPLQTGPELP